MGRATGTSRAAIAAARSLEYDNQVFYAASDKANKVVKSTQDKIDALRRQFVAALAECGVEEAERVKLLALVGSIQDEQCKNCQAKIIASGMVAAIKPPF